MAKRIKVSAEQRARIEARLPAGLKCEDIRIVPASATFEQPTEVELQVAEEMTKAGGPKMITDGKPTIMRVVAWMAHAEVINKNGAMFHAADLQKAAEKIKQPDFLPMDFNHSAVDRWGWEQKAIGVWYKAEFKHDPNATAADGSKGADGILATGMMWSWMNPGIANTLLAEQQRHGKIDFSMACIAGSVTKGKRDSDGQAFEILHDPVFFTLSALDVPPADPDAVGVGEEGSGDAALESRLETDLNARANHEAFAAAALEVLRAHTTPNARPTDEAAQLTEEGRMDELLKFLQENADKMADKETLSAMQAKLDETAKAITENLTASAKLAETQTALDAANTALEKANTTIEEQNTALEEANGKLAKIAEQEAAKAADEKLVARKAELDENYLAAHDKREDKEAVEARWKKMSDEEWTAFKADISVIKVARSYLDRSKAEGVLPTGAAEESDKGAGRLSRFK